MNHGLLLQRKRKKKVILEQMGGGAQQGGKPVRGVQRRLCGRGPWVMTGVMLGSGKAASA